MTSGEKSSIRSVSVVNEAGQIIETIPVPRVLYTAKAASSVVHQVSVAELAGRRQGTASTKRRDEVSGSGAKIRRQKGTGRSRQGDKRVPHQRGGGVAHGPKPRKYKEKTPRKMRQLAFRTALNSRLQHEKFLVLGDLHLDVPKTKRIKTLFDVIGISQGKILMIVDEAESDKSEEFVLLSSRNLPNVKAQGLGQTNCTDVLWSDYVIFTHKAWYALIETRLSPIQKRAIQKDAPPSEC